MANDMIHPSFDPQDIEIIAMEAMLLNHVAELSYTDTRAALGLLGQFKNSGKIDFLRAAVVGQIAIHMRDEPEFCIRARFFENLGSYIAGATITKVRLIHGHKPDGFVKIDGDVAPVEVKKMAFNSRALAQLQRYMGEYNCKRGVAVARILTCEIPSNVTFVKVEV